MFDDSGEAKRFAPATERNRDAIGQVLSDIMPPSGRALEIASGTGEHAVHFAALFPQMTWQPSDPDPLALASIAAWGREAGVSNLLEPVQIDAAAQDWGVDGADIILCINMIHIAPWQAAIGLLAGAGRLLPENGLLYLYGPFREDGVALAESNAAFDASLKSRNPLWGLKLLSDVTALAKEHGLALESRKEMPANNLSLIFRKS